MTLRTMLLDESVLRSPVALSAATSQFVSISAHIILCGIACNYIFPLITFEVVSLFFLVIYFYNLMVPTILLTTSHANAYPRPGFTVKCFAVSLILFNCTCENENE